MYIGIRISVDNRQKLVYSSSLSSFIMLKGFIRVWAIKVQPSTKRKSPNYVSTKLGEHQTVPQTPLMIPWRAASRPPLRFISARDRKQLRNRATSSGAQLH